jgi:hypothetical protein
MHECMRSVVSDVWPARENVKLGRRKKKEDETKKGAEPRQRRGMRIKDGGWFSNCHTRDSPIAGVASVRWVSMATRCTTVINQPHRTVVVSTIAMITSQICQSVSTLITIRNHSLYPVNIRAKTSQLHLLALTGLNSQRIGIYPLIRRDIGRLVGVYKDVEHGCLVDDG